MLEDDTLFHLEIQSTNDSLMPRRMLEYGLLMYENYNIFPRQIRSVSFIEHDDKHSEKDDIQLLDELFVKTPDMLANSVMIPTRDYHNAFFFNCIH